MPTVQLNKESQFGMLHEVARLGQHNEVLEHEHTQKIRTPVQYNSLEPLIRMCGSRLQRMHKLNENLLKNLTCGTTKHTNTSEQQKLIEDCD